MYTNRSLDGSPEDLLSPSFRLVNFSDEGAIVLVSVHLRHAWTAAPGADTGPDAVGAFIAASHNRSEEERRAVLQYPDKEALHTPWRDQIYHQWNHVFYDVANFLVSVGPGIGHLHPPAHETFALTYPMADRGEGGGQKHMWEDNVLVIPAHLERGVSVRMSTADEDGEEKTLGTFRESTPADIWYIKRGTVVKLHVEAEYENVRVGLAAVLVCGRLDLECPSQHGDGSELEAAHEEASEEDSSGEREGEADKEDEEEEVERNEDEYEQPNDEWEDDDAEDTSASHRVSH